MKLKLDQLEYVDIIVSLWNQYDWQIQRTKTKQAVNDTLQIIIDTCNDAIKDGHEPAYFQNHITKAKQLQ